MRIFTVYRSAAILFGTLLSIALLTTAVTAQPSPTSAQRKTPTERKQRRKEKQILFVGDLAPTFTLSSIDGKEKTNTDDFRGQRPLILFFGSYT